MELGAFSISLAVQNLEQSRAFYEGLGFSMVGGDPEQNWLILRSGSTTIGLFQGMFEKNILTFNPGWDSDSSELAEFTDIRQLQKRITGANIEITSPIDSDTEGPASFIVEDPDGNQIMFDQHR